MASSDAAFPMSASSSSSSSSPAAASASKQHVIILPGCGCSPVSSTNWYANVAAALNALPQYQAVCEDMPDPDDAHRDIWLPFIRDRLQPTAASIVIGHSSGAEAAMRLCETQRVKGLLLVSACHSDLGVESERLSGWYDGGWDWEAIRGNAGWIVQLHGKDDRLVPLAEGRQVAQHLHSQLIEQDNRGHYLRRTLPDILHILQRKRKEEEETQAGQQQTATAGAASDAEPVKA